MGFVLTNLEERLRDTYSFYRGVRKSIPSDPKAQHLVGISAIEADTLFLAGRGLRSVLQVDPINYGLLDESQKKAVTVNFREFLNHLTTPVQVLIKTVVPDLGGYFERAQDELKGAPKELRAFFDDFLIFEEEFLEKNNVRERNYYLIVTHEPTKRGKKPAEQFEELKQLDQRTKIVQEKLLSCGLKSSRLENASLRRFFAAYASQDAETSELETPEQAPAKEETGEKPNFALEAITPEFDVKPDHALVNGVFHRIVKATGYPRKVEDGWLESFLAASEPYDISLHVHPATISGTLVALHNQIVKQTTDLAASTSTGTPNPALEIKRQDTMNVYQMLYKGEEKMFQVSLYVDSQAQTLADLDLLTEKCKANLNALLIIPKTLDFRMADGIKSMFPTAKDAIGVRKEFLTSSLSATFPFLYPVDSKKKGLFFAHEKNTLNPLFIDFETMSNKHFFVLGISGSGKSYTSKFLVMQHLLAHRGKVYILDPNAEYVALSRKMKGEVITLSKDSETIINLFDLAGEDYGSKMLTLISVFDIITGGLSEGQKGVLNQALGRVYRRKGIDAANPATWKNTPPTFSDLRKVLKEMYDQTEKSGRFYEEKSLEVLLNRVRMYSKGGFFGFMDKATKVDLKNDFIDFNLSALPSQVKQLVMFSVLELISREIKKDKDPKVVLIDEGWSLLRSKEAENYILDFIKTSRKHNAAIGFITQEIEDLLRSEGGKSILNTTSTKILLKQNASNLDLITKTLALNDKERDYLLRADKGQGLLITEQGRHQFVVNTPPKIHDLITTDPNEKAAPLPKQNEAKTAGEIKIDLERGFYPYNDLIDDQRVALENAGYVLYKGRLQKSGGSTYYLVKKQGKESADHALLCWYIADEARKRGAKAKVNSSVDADVSIEYNDRKICFEVETGESLDFHGSDMVRQKMKERQNQYDTLVIVVTHWQQKNTYRRLCTTNTISRAQIAETVENLLK